MPRRLLMGTLAALTILTAVLAAVTPSLALSAWFAKGKSDCSSVDSAITLTYTHDDTGDDEDRDHFRLELYDNFTGTLLASIDESITREQSPFYWQTGRLIAAVTLPEEKIKKKEGRGIYRIEVWDTDDKGNKVNRVEHVFLQCETNESWREDPPHVTQEVNVPPSIECYARMRVYTTNRAPEDGAIVVQWTLGPSRDEDIEYHLYSIPVSRGDTFDGDQELNVPCGQYIRLYYQPNSTKLLYYLPSQYYPHDLYGSELDENDVGPIYHTFFPLDGPSRNATATPSPTPSPSPSPEEDEITE